MLSKIVHFRVRSFSVLLSIGIVLTGCAIPPTRIDTNDFSYASNNNFATTTPAVSNVLVKNEAADGKYERQGLLGGARAPCFLDPAPKLLVEKDFNHFFAASTQIEPTANRKIVVTIKKASCHIVASAMQAMPYVGIALAATERTLSMEVTAVLEVEQDGKVDSSFYLERETEISRKLISQEDIHAAMRALIAAYRLEVYSELDHSFLRRYL